jgi:hypothetical protein
MKSQFLTRGAALVAVMTVLAAPAFSETVEGSGSCHAIAGTFSTNLGVVDQNTSLGSVTGDLRGAVAATILNVTQNSDGSVSFLVQHHLVTETGDTITFDLATAVAVPLSPTLFAVRSYPVHINGGTGRYAKTHGDFTNIGEVDLGSGKAVFRYTGHLCST